MAIVLKDRVKETAPAPGTGTISLGGATAGFQAFSAIGNGNVTYFAIVDSISGEWEVNYGTYTTSGATLTRNATPLSSSAAGARVNFTGAVDVFCTYPSEKAIYEETTGNVLIDGGPITVIGAGVTTYSTFSAALGELYGNINSFAQLYAQNLNDGSSASTDIVAYNDLGDGTNNFIDMGINSSNYTDAVYPIFTPGSGYVYNDGGELIIGSATDDVLLFAGGVATTDWAARIDKTTKLLTTKAGLTVGGALTGVGASFTAPVTSTSSMVAPGATEFITRAYVDEATSNGFHVHTPVLVATTGNLTATYNQPGGAGDGVGATLTNSGTQVALEIDGVSLATNDRVLVYQQTTGFQNGIYVVTTVGSGATNWVLTRSADANTSSEGDPGTLGGGDYFFVQSGTTQGFFAFICTNTSAIVFGTTSIDFNEFSQVPVYTGTAPINVSGQIIALTGTVAATNGGTGASTVTTGDLLYGSGTNTWGKLPKGAAYKSLVMDASATNVEWNAVALNQSGSVSGALPATNGGTGLNAYTLGDTIYSSAANTISALAGNATTTKKFLTQTGTGAVSAAPSWEVVNGADVTGNISGSAGSVANALTAGSYLTSGGTFNGAAARTFAVDATDANTASKVVARDASGNFSAGTISAALSGNATSATNLAGGAANQIAYQSGSGATSFATAPSSSGQVLGWNGSALAWTTTIATATSATTATTATTANNVSGIVAVANGGTGTSTPSLVAGTNVTITGSFPNQTINATGGGGGATNSISQLDTSVTVTDGVTSFTASVAPSTPFNIEVTSSGTTLTVNKIQGTGTIVVGAVLSGVGIIPNTIVTALGTGTGGTGTYTISASITSGTLRTLTVTYGTMTVTAVTSGTLAIGQKITNKRTTAVANSMVSPNTYITGFGTGVGNTGTYIVNNSFTLVSDTLYAGGLITSTADDNTVTVVDGSGMSVRSAFTPSDWQGTIASGRMMGIYTSRTVGGAAPFYFADYNRSGSIQSADSLDVTRITSGSMNIPYPMAFSSAYGSNGVNAGLGFISLSNTDTIRAAVNSPVSSNVNAVVLGFSSAGSPPRVVISRADDNRPAAINYNAQAHLFGNAGVYYGTPATITSSTLVLPFTSHYLTFNTTSTCTITFPSAGAGTAFVGIIDNGSGTAAGTTLTVTSVNSGALYVGMQLFSEALGDGLTPFSVTAFGTGTGNTGTYTVSSSLWLSLPYVFSPGLATGRRLVLRNIASFAVNSASANVVPLAGGAPGTAILPATPGKWCELVFDGTNWQTMASN